MAALVRTFVFIFAANMVISGVLGVVFNSEFLLYFAAISWALMTLFVFVYAGLFITARKKRRKYRR